MSIFTAVFGTHSNRELKRITPIADAVEALEAKFKALTDAELRGMTEQFKQRLQNGETTDDILPEAFAVCREASHRVLGMRPFRVQIIGGIVLHQGRIAEMKTGEGKTLVATLPAYLNALSGKGVHVVTVNDYLAKFQSEWMGNLYRFLGLTVGLVVHGVTGEARKAAYDADITYGTNNEFGFDYLRDNMAIYKENMVQRGHNFSIVDEVDSILIDEARTPLIISGQGEKSTALYEQADRFVAGLRKTVVRTLEAKEDQDDIEGDYVVDEKARSATLTPSGMAKAEKAFAVENLADGENTTLLHHINLASRARGVMHRDTDYVVKDGEVIIVDEFTGRLMFGRRYSEGLHQAIEAKERVKVEHESKTLATITFQNYFRLYDKLSGMTGTATTEAEEFQAIYKLDVIEIPTNKPMVREDLPDSVYKNQAGKTRAILNQIEECHEKGQPVLVGTISIDKSESLSSALKKRGIKHVVLNAKHHEKEAEIVAQAGHYGAVTIATNMAGRGTDILLGGNAEFMARAELKKLNLPEEAYVEAIGFAETDNGEILKAREFYQQQLATHKKAIADEADRVRAAGGLFIIGTERHESRRIDNQLRGRAGRQGDPGQSRFFLALDDDLMRLFGTDRVTGLMERLGFDEDTPIENKMLTNRIEGAQKNVESRNFQTRKHVLQYDDVMNRQREIIYGQRKKVLDGDDVRDNITAMTDEWIERTVKSELGEKHYFESAEQLARAINPFNGMLYPAGQLTAGQFDENKVDDQDIIDAVKDAAHNTYHAKELRITEPLMRELERVVLLRTVDSYWMDHIDAMDELRKGIGLRAYAQTDPVVAYKQEGFELFDEMINSIRENTVRTVFLAELRTPEAPKREQVAKVTGASLGGERVKNTTVRKAQKVGRNDPCPCGSGKKYKKCCGMESGSAQE